MFVTTFLSKADEVGRIAAAINVAAELTRRGRKVLLVDFDLETAQIGSRLGLADRPGVAEFIEAFRSNLEVPNVRDFIHPVSFDGEGQIRVWVMPGGGRDRARRISLGSFDWFRFFREEWGFDLFDDAKLGWQKEFALDYVLIVARAGDGPLFELCARRLPDSVAMMVTANADGLARLREFRDEIARASRKIGLNCVALNVPLGDDARGRWRRRMKAFRNEFGPASTTIHRCDDPILLDDGAVVLEFPRSRLAREYRRLAAAVIRANPADPEGGRYQLREFAKKHLSPWARTGKVTRSIVDDEIECRFGEPEPIDVRIEDSIDWALNERERLDKITKSAYEANDSEWIVEIARCRMLRGEIGPAIQCLNRAIGRDSCPTDALLWRALCLKKQGEMKLAADDAFEFLRRCPSESALVALRELAAFRREGFVEPERMMEAAALSAIGELNYGDRVAACEILARFPETLSDAIRLLRSSDDPDAYRPWLHACLIRAGLWRDVIDPIESHGSRDLAAIDAFHLAAAHWGESGTLQPEACRIALCNEPGRRFNSESAELQDLLADIRRGKETGSDGLWRYRSIWPMVLWGVGRTSDAVAALDSVEKEVRESRVWIYSAWRLQTVSADEFLADCKSMRRLFDGENIRPEFLARPNFT